MHLSIGHLTLLVMVVTAAEGRGASESDVCLGPCNPATRLQSESVYLRYAPGSSSFDYLVDALELDRIDEVHYRADPNVASDATGIAPYLCVTATAASGGSRSYTGWVDARCVCNCPGSSDCSSFPFKLEIFPPPAVNCYEGRLKRPDNRPTQIPCVVLNPEDTQLLSAPYEGAPTVPFATGFAAKYKRCIGWETLPGPVIPAGLFPAYGAGSDYDPRPPINGYIWGMRKFSPARRVSGRGWVKGSEVFCANQSCNNDPHGCARPRIRADELVRCAGNSQICDALFRKRFSSRILERLHFTVFAHCSPVRVHVYVDGSLVQTTPFLGWSDDAQNRPLSFGPIVPGPVSSGSHLLELRAEGMREGCNGGRLELWQALLVESQDAGGVP